ncbi:hypothetical protein [Peribacillus sp. SCS-37]|uniref:hypothetical protein n=1 Tax=Paraperibacillus esterisolvens TaxID=3115296 RepID=UPI0039064F2B
MTELEAESSSESTGEKQIISGVWFQTIGHILEAVSVTNQIGLTDTARLLEEQKTAIAGDVLVSLGAAIEAAGGLKVLKEEEQSAAPLIVT